MRSSFYLVATKVNPAHPAAVSAVAGWKADWREATFAYAKHDTTADGGDAPPPSSIEGEQ